MIQKVRNWEKAHRSLLFRLAILTLLFGHIPNVTHAAISSAGAGMPGYSGVMNVYSWLTGWIPATIGAIGLAGSCITAIMGELGPVGKFFLRIAFGTSGAMLSPSIIDLFTAGKASAALFM